MQVLVYRSTRREGAYILTDRGDTFDHIPDALLTQLGQLEFAFEFDLTPDRSLARTDGATVLSHIEQQGFYLQMPEEQRDPPA